MSNYYSSGGKRYTMDSSWSCMSLAAKLAQSVRLIMFALLDAMKCCAQLAI